MMEKCEETGQEEVKRLKMECRLCPDVGPDCWDCEVQERIDYLTDFVVFAEFMAKQGRNPDGTEIEK